MYDINAEYRKMYGSCPVVAIEEKRGDYVIKNGWIYNIAKGDYGSCIMGDLEYFINVVKRNPESYKLTSYGKQLFDIVDKCGKGIKCTYCHERGRDKNCRVYNK
jgi:hypothetical protein